MNALRVELVQVNVAMYEILGLERPEKPQERPETGMARVREVTDTQRWRMGEQHIQIPTVNDSVPQKMRQKSQHA